MPSVSEDARITSARQVRVAHKDAVVKLLATDAFRRREERLLSDFMWCVTECEQMHAAKFSKLIEDSEDPDDATASVSRAIMELASSDAKMANVLRDIGTGKASLTTLYDYFEVPLTEEAKDAFNAANAYRTRVLSWISGRTVQEQRTRYDPADLATPEGTQEALVRFLERSVKSEAALAAPKAAPKPKLAEPKADADAAKTDADAVKTDGDTATTDVDAAKSEAAAEPTELAAAAVEEVEDLATVATDKAELALYEKLEASPDNQFRFFRKELPYYASDDLVIQAPAGTDTPRRRHGDEHQWLELGEEIEETLPYDYWEDADRNIRDSVRYVKWLSALPDEELEDVLTELDPALENEEFTDPGLAVADAEQTFMHALHVTFPHFFTVQRLSAYFGVSMARASAILRLKEDEYEMRRRGESIDAYFGEQMETASGLHDMWMEDQDHRMVRYVKLYTMLRRHTLRQALGDIGLHRASLPPVADEIQTALDELTRGPDGVDVVAPSFDDLPDGLKALAGSRDAYLTERDRRELVFVDDPQGLEEDWSFLRQDEEEAELDKLVRSSEALKVAAGVDEPKRGSLPRLVLVDEHTKVVPRTATKKKVTYPGLFDAVDPKRVDNKADPALKMGKDERLGNARHAFKFVDKSKPVGARTVTVREKDGVLRRGTPMETTRANPKHGVKMA